jgi:hypothetical protein
MNNGGNERLDRIEDNMDKLQAFVVQSMERQSAAEHRQEKTQRKLDETLGILLRTVDEIIGGRAN